MARVTIEDCLEKIENRFALVLLVTKRAKQLLKGSKTVLTSKFDSNNKYIVTSLREVAAGKTDFEIDVANEEATKQVEDNLQR